MPLGGEMVTFAAAPTSETSCDPAAPTVTEGATIVVPAGLVWPLDVSIGVRVSTPL